MTKQPERCDSAPQKNEAPARGAPGQKTFGGVGNTLPKNDKHRKPSRRAIKLTLDWQAPVIGGRDE